MTNCTHCFYIPSKGYGSRLIDLVHPRTGLGVWSGETAEQIAARYSAPVEVVTVEEAGEREELASITAPVEITREAFEEMLNMLPPKHWRRGGEIESFQMIEHYSGRVTGTYVRVGDRFWCWNDVAGLPAADLRAKLPADAFGVVA